MNDTNATGNGKNIVIFSDGTGQEGGVEREEGEDEGNTNVYKLFRMTETRSARQISFYDRGLGTGTRKLISSVTGAGMSQNILECYQFIFDNYCDGDRIFLFGFSRGAATVRSLAGFIDLFGILPNSRPEFIKRAYDIYKIKDEQERLKKADEFIQANNNLWCDIQFLGVWDTVAALGVPSPVGNALLEMVPAARHEFHDYTLSKRVKHARHAVAIDDARKSFHPLLWNEKVEETQTLKQVWFSGMHTDVGGGYLLQDLSDIPLNWMVREAIQQGLRIYSKHEVESRPSASGMIHNSSKWYFKESARKDCKRLKELELVSDFIPTVHESVVERKNEVDSYDPWILTRDYKKEPFRNDVEELTKVLEELEKFLGTLQPSGLGGQGNSAADHDKLAALQARLEVTLKIAHALLPRGVPEEAQNVKGLRPLEDRKLLRRERGKDRGEMFVQARGLVDSLNAIRTTLISTEQPRQDFSRLYEDYETKALNLYGYFLERNIDEVYRAGGKAA